MTHNEHIVPVGYLKQFADNSYKKQPHIFQYDTTHDVPYMNNPVPLNSIEYEYDLYEHKLSNGQYFLPNASELSLKSIEDSFYRCRNQIIQKTHIVNFLCENFLTLQEQGSLILMIASQILRYPEILSESISFYKDVFRSAKPETQKILAKMMCIPTWIRYPHNIIQNQAIRAFQQIANYPPVLMKLMENLGNLNLRIGYTSTKNIVTCDRPIIAEVENGYFTNIIYPIAPTHVVYMFHEAIIPKFNNTIFVMNDEQIQFVNNYLFVNAKRWIYKQTNFQQKEIQQIENQRKTRIKTIRHIANKRERDLL